MSFLWDFLSWDFSMGERSRMKLRGFRPKSAAVWMDPSDGAYLGVVNDRSDSGLW